MQFALQDYVFNSDKNTAHVCCTFSAFAEDKTFFICEHKGTHSSQFLLTCCQKASESSAQRRAGPARLPKVHPSPPVMVLVAINI